MADIRIKDLPTTATQTASDDFIALDGTVNGTRKIDASAPSFKTSVTSPSIVAPATTALTLAGGSTGASLVLGATTNGVATLKSLGTGRTVISSALGATTPTAAVFNDTLNTRTTFGIIGNGGSSQTVLQFGYGLVTAPTNTGSIFVSASDFILSTAGSLSFGLTGGAEWARFATSTGNLLIGTTTDITGTGGLHVAGTSTASTTTSGALRVGSNVGLSGNAGGASYFGGTVNITSTAAQAGLSVSNSSGNIPTIYLRQNNSATGDFTLQNKNATSGYVSFSAGGGVDSLRIYPTTGNAVVVSTTSASSSTVGALTIGNGTAATNVAIGGGNVFLGGTITSSNTAGGQFFSGEGGATTNRFANVSNAGGQIFYGVESSAGGSILTGTTAYGGVFATNNSTALHLGTNGASRVTIGATGIVSVVNSTPSTLTTNGALVVTGGVGVGGAMNVGGAVNVAGQIITNTGTAAAPIISLNGTANGLYYTGANIVRIAAAGVEAATFAGSAANFTGTGTFAGAVSGVSVVSTANANAGGLYSFIANSAGAPRYAWKKANASVNQTLWDIDGGIDGQLSIRAINDADNAASVAMTVTRSGATVTGISFPTGAVTAASTVQVGTVLRVGGATASFPGLRNTGAQLDVVTASNSAWADIAAAQFKQSDNGISWSSGTGSPEGVKTAPVGSLYSRTDGGASTTLYVKQSGTGNTGWVAK